MNVKRSSAVVLSIFQGEKYLSRQLDSILGQTWKNFTLYIRDDGSTDRSLSILERYARKDHRIKLLSDTQGNLGLTGSLKILLGKVKEEILFFADQDDEWLPHKMETMISHSQTISFEVPWLVFSDLLVTDDQLNLLYPSFWKLAGINPEKIKFEDVLRKNPVTGCASAINRNMLNMIKDMPRCAVHDWWLACMAALNGHLIPVKEALVKYRQHDSNVIGAHQGGIWRIWPLIKDSSARKAYLNRLDHIIKHLREINRLEKIKQNPRLLKDVQSEILRRKRHLKMLNFWL